MPSCNAVELDELRRLEKEQGIEPDPDIDAFMKANAIEGKRESIETEYVLHVLGLNVCADTMVNSMSGLTWLVVGSNLVEMLVYDF